MKNILTGLILFFITLTTLHSQVISLADALEDLNNDYIPDRLGDTVTVEATVYSPRFHSVANTYFVYDGTAGTNVYMPAPPTFNWELGDKLQITGTVAHYFGLSEIIALDSASWVLISPGNPLPEPEVLTLSEYFATPEAYEGSLVGFESLFKVAGEWPAPFTNRNILLSDGQDTIEIKINKYTDVSFNPEPSWPVDIMGCAQQSTSNVPADDGYQIMLRFYSDILPPGTLPVELTSFAAQMNGTKVLLNWKTETELNNHGFEIQRNLSNSAWNVIGFIEGAGTSTEEKNYSFIDDIEHLSNGTISYRLKQLDFGGTFQYSKIVEISNFAITYQLSQNYPNPFNPSTTIKYSVPKLSNVQLKVFDVLGNEIAELVNEQNLVGNYEVEFDASKLTSGVYFYKLKAGQFVEIKKMILMK